MATTLASVEEIIAAVGNKLGTSAWLEISQERVNKFADATNDHQWIHVDEDKAKEGPFGATIAHGYLTLSLLSHFMPEIILVPARMGINYGVNKVRFPAPVPVGSRIRAHGELVEATEVDGGVQITVRITVELDGADKPVCVADSLSRFYF